MEQSKFAKRVLQQSTGVQHRFGGTVGYGVRLPSAADISPSAPSYNPLQRFAISFASPFQQGAKVVSRALGAGDETETQRKSVSSLDATREKVLRTLRDPKVPKARKDILLSLLDDETRDTVMRETEQRKIVESDVDIKKNLAAAAEIASFGFGGKGIYSAYKAGGNAAVKSALLQTGISGAAAGGGATAREDGSTPLDILQGAATGAVAGVALSGGAALVGKGVRSAKELPNLSDTKLGGAIAQTKTGQEITKFKDNFMAKVVDDTNFIKKPFRGLTDSTSGNKVTDEIEALVTNVRQFTALSQQRLANNKSYQGLRELIGGDKQAYDDLGKFISKKQTAINNQKLGKKSVVPVGTAQQEEAYKLLNQSTKDDIQYLFDNGRITQENYTKWMDDPNYTRVQREVLDDQKQQFGSKGLAPKAKSVTEQHLKGSTKDAIDPFTAYDDWSRRITLEVEKNNLAKYIRDQSVIAGKSNKLQTTDAALEKIRKLYGEEGVKQQTLGVFDKGVRELYTIDPRAARQIAGAADLELKAIAEWILMPSRVLRGGATQMNAAFAVPNFIRDQIYSFITSSKARATHNPIAFVQGFKEAILKPTGKATIGKIPGVRSELFEPSDTFKAWLGRNQYSTRADLARNLKKASRESMENLGVKGESPIRKYENIISATEKATRYQNYIGMYKDAIRRGVDPEEAVKLANKASRENSINFTRRGELATFMKIFNPYFNAGVQGSARLGRSIKERPVATSMKIGVSVMAPVATATYYNLSDPERAELYARIPERERRDNLIMVLGGGRGYIKVPMPPGIRDMATPARNYIESEYLGDRQGLLETAKNLFFDPFSPVGTTKNELLSNAVPQAVRPAVEIGMNRNLYFGSEIIPKNLQGLPPEEQVRDSTPQIYRDIAKVLGVSPLQVRQGVTGYGAGGTEGALTLIDAARGAETGGRTTPEQLSGRFYQPAKEGQGEVTSKFYDAYTPLRALKENRSKQVTAAIKAGDIDKANKIANQINEDVEKQKTRLRETYGRFETDLSALYDQFDSLKFPIENGRLKQSSINARQKQR